MIKKITFIFLLALFTTSCDTLGSAKRALTGEKNITTDEFLVKKKDPLILPPDYENLPTPKERSEAAEEIEDFEKTLGISIEENTEKPSSVEGSILKKIRNK